MASAGFLSTETHVCPDILREVDPVVYDRLQQPLKIFVAQPLQASATPAAPAAPTALAAPGGDSAPQSRENELRSLVALVARLGDENDLLTRIATKVSVYGADYCAAVEQQTDENQGILRLLADLDRGAQQAAQATRVRGELQAARAETARLRSELTAVQARLAGLEGLERRARELRLLAEQGAAEHRELVRTRADLRRCVQELRRAAQRAAKN